MENEIIPAPATEETKALNASIDAQESENKDPADVALAAEAKTEEKPELTEHEKHVRRLERKNERLVQQRAALREKLNSFEGLTQKPESVKNDGAESDKDTLSLSPAEIQKRIEERARQLAPEISRQAEEDRRKRSVLARLGKEFGEKFDAIASDLDDAFDGIVDQETGKPKPATDAILGSDEPAALIAYLADPQNTIEAQGLSRMSAVQAGRAIALLELKLKSKPKPSKVPPPIEEVRGQGTTSKRTFDLEGAEFARARRKQIESRR